MSGLLRSSEAVKTWDMRPVAKIIWPKGEGGVNKNDREFGAYVHVLVRTHVYGNQSPDEWAAAGTELISNIEPSGSAKRY